MTDERLAEIAARAGAATAPPWVYLPWSGSNGPFGDILRGDQLIGRLTDSVLAAEQDDRNGPFVAHARQDIPDLLAHVADLRAELDTLRRIFGDQIADNDALRLAYERGSREAVSTVSLTHAAGTAHGEFVIEP